MLINKDWDFETAINEISKVYRPGGITTGQLRNRQVEAWGQLVGKARALAEFDSAIKKYGSLSAFGREYRVTLPTLHNFRQFFENLPDDQVAESLSESKVSNSKKVFISYSWDSDDHKNWVRELATRLRGDGIDVTLDQWHVVPGDQLPEFMEQAIRESAYVLIICTHKYKERSDNRQGGVGYEGDIISAEFMTTRNQRKFIPILRQQSWNESAPHSMLGKLYIDFSSSPYIQKSYDDLLTTLLGNREKAPPVGGVKMLSTRANFIPEHKQKVLENAKFTVRRKTSWTLTPCSCTIYVDDLPLGGINDGEIELFEIKPGKHTVHVRFRGQGVYNSRSRKSADIDTNSKKITMDFSPGAHYSFVCSINSFTGTHLELT